MISTLLAIQQVQKDDTIEITVKAEGEDAIILNMPRTATYEYLRSRIWPGEWPGEWKLSYLKLLKDGETAPVRLSNDSDLKCAFKSVQDGNLTIIVKKVITEACKNASVH